MTQYLRLWDMAAAIVLDDAHQDTVIWRFESVGMFSTSSAYTLLYGEHGLRLRVCYLEIQGPPSAQVLHVARCPWPLPDR